MSRAPFQIVPALPGDARELARLEAACFAHPRSEAALLEELRQPERYLLVTAKREGALLGYAGLEHVLDEGYLTDVAVFPEHRRQGLARGLLRALAARGRETLGLSFLTLEVRPGNWPQWSCTAPRATRRWGGGKISIPTPGRTPC